MAWLEGAVGAVRVVRRLGALLRSGRRVERRAWNKARRIGTAGGGCIPGKEGQRKNVGRIGGGDRIDEVLGCRGEGWRMTSPPPIILLQA